MIAATDCAYETCTSSTGVGFLVGMIVVYLVIAALAIWLYARIIGKTGYSRWWVLLMFVPIGNLVGLVLFAVKEWPIEQEVRMLRLSAHAAQRSTTPPQYGAGYGVAAGEPYGTYGAGTYGQAGYGAGMYGAGAYGATPGQPAPSGQPGTTPGWPTSGAPYGQQPPYGDGTQPTQQPPTWG